ncbi:MAG: hypothetical protein QM784_29905 [Polyangiaceae bacterium]
MRLHRDPVKHSTLAAQQKGIWSRWLDGWELVIPSVGLAVLAAWLALPQPTLPRYLPLPTLAPTELDAAKRRLQSEVNHVRKHSLSFETRSLGERFRRLGRAMHDGIEIRSDERERFRAQVRKALDGIGVQELRELRAIQTELFVEALGQFEKTSIASADLDELGGDFLALAASKQWIRFPGGGTSVTLPPTVAPGRVQVLLSEDEVRSVFLVRWTDFFGVFEHPELRLEPSWIALMARLRLRVPVERLDSRDLAVIARLEASCPEYPAALARGILLGKLGAYESASTNLREHLQIHGEGDFSLRARNHLLFVERAMMNQDTR